MTLLQYIREQITQTMSAKCPQSIPPRTIVFFPFYPDGSGFRITMAQGLSKSCIYLHLLLRMPLSGVTYCLHQKRYPHASTNMSGSKALFTPDINMCPGCSGHKWTALSATVHTWH